MWECSKYVQHQWLEVFIANPVVSVKSNFQDTGSSQKDEYISKIAYECLVLRFATNVFLLVISELPPLLKTKYLPFSKVNCKNLNGLSQHSCWENALFWKESIGKGHKKFYTVPVIWLPQKPQLMFSVLPVLQGHLSPVDYPSFI